MNRYQDNISPEPNIGLNLNECYKTPNLQQYSSVYTVNQLYPTPPSDSDSSPATEQSSKISPDNFSTPILGYYDQNSFNNESQDGSLYRKIHHEEKNAQPNVDLKSTSRFKRRSRTTYTKTQLDALESTFQKTHYPEIRVVDDLSSMLNLSTERISIWFQNRRARFKKARKLETQENRLAMEGSNQLPNNGYTYPTGYTMPNYQNTVSAKQENFPLNRNIFSSFAPIQEDQSLRTPFSDNLNNQNYYSQIPGMQQSLSTSLAFYQNHLTPKTSGYYQSYPILYPPYQSSNIQ